MAVDSDDAQPCASCGYLNCHCDDQDADTVDPESDMAEAERNVFQGLGEPTLRIGQFRLYGDPGTMFQAIGAAQDACETLNAWKDGQWDNKYLPLPDLLDEVVPALRAEDFVLLQPIADVGGHPHVVTIIGHEDGDLLATSQSVPQPPNMQEFGSNLTYTKRYAIEAFLALAAQEDDDAAHAASRKKASSSGNPQGSSQKQGGNGGPTSSGDDARWEFRPDNGLLDRHKEQLDEMGWNNADGEPHWWGYFTPAEAAQHKEDLEEIGTVTKGGGS